MNANLLLGKHAFQDFMAKIFNISQSFLFGSPQTDLNMGKPNIAERLKYSQHLQVVSYVFHGTKANYATIWRCLPCRLCLISVISK